MTKAHFKTRLWASRTTLKKPPNKLAWRIEQPLLYWSPIIGPVTVPRGFITDFASVPRLPFAFILFGDRVHAPAVVHDYLCSTLWPTRRITWAQAAEVFHEAMKADGVPWFQRWPMFLGVRLFGVATLRP